LTKSAAPVVGRLKPHSGGADDARCHSKPPSTPGTRPRCASSKKSGFVREGVLAKSIFKDGEIVDSVLYARLK
jgi:hypothetical protein